MKNVLLIGNGFDLYHKFPTKYADFLHVVHFLKNNKNAKNETVGSVFSNRSLQIADPFIEVCYDAHKKIYDSTKIDQKNIDEIITLINQNIWFNYLYKMLNRDVGWIDFEKEIGFVLKCFSLAFKKSPVLTFNSKEHYAKYVIDAFEFFVDKFASKNMMTLNACRVSGDYCEEKPMGSQNQVINKMKVVEKLYNELRSLSKALSLYLKCFVEGPCELMSRDDAYERLKFFSYIERAITFNYTNTYERFYFNNVAFHIHGSVDDEIVLGVNSDEADKLENIDTTLVCFKKYFQRTLFETDIQYMRWLNETVDLGTQYRLITMGHSLDVTDKDIIEELFRCASEIIVLYHNLEAKKTYITNLIEIFGKDGFDALKNNKKLTFTSLNQDLSFLAELLGQESLIDFSKMIL